MFKVPQASILISDTLERTFNISILVTKLKAVCAVPHIMENTLCFQYFKERACLAVCVGRNSEAYSAEFETLSWRGTIRLPLLRYTITKGRSGKNSDCSILLSVELLKNYTSRESKIGLS
ncbi:hypothetical protein SAMN05428978_1002191 [Nitrosomonas sp. Nm34]|nr:hypothetical protein SAMN05428978_1002191 [Nitrosomonas sp. Nm34]